MMKLSMTFAPLMVAILCYTAEAFAPAAVSRTTLGRVSVSSTVGVQLRMSEEDEVGLPTLPSQRGEAPKDEPVAPAPVVSAPVASINTNAVVEEEEGTAYPIDLPSPALLALSMVLAISSIGSLFELTGGTATKLGFGPTAALAAIGFPTSMYLIYAAILKGAAETEEDDKEYNNNLNSRRRL